MKVSIITPIYNAEDHISKSIDSILNQSYENLELILINDGSTDKTKEICTSYELKDKRVTLVNIKNSGPGRARNKGMELAKGDYLSFVDADDWLKEDAIESLMTKALEKNYDVVTGSYFLVKGREVIDCKNEYGDREMNKLGTVEDRKHYNFFKVSSSSGYVWAKVYKRSFLEKNSIKFSEERKVFLEDTLFNLKIFAYNPRYYILDKPIYYYNVLENSLSNKSEDITDRAIKVIEDYESFLDRQNLYDENFDLFIALASRTISYSLFKTIDYKFSLKSLYGKVNRFSTNDTVQRLFLNKDSLKNIREINSILQIFLYSFIILCVRYKFKLLLSIVFYLFYPIFNVYVKNFLKG